VLDLHPIFCAIPSARLILGIAQGGFDASQAYRRYHSLVAGALGAAAVVVHQAGQSSSQ